MKRQSRKFRWTILFSLASSTLHVSCIQGILREAQFGVLDGVNGFFAEGVEAFLVSVVPFLIPA